MYYMAHSIPNHITQLYSTSLQEFKLFFVYEMPTTTAAAAQKRSIAKPSNER